MLLPYRDRKHGAREPFLEVDMIRSLAHACFVVSDLDRAIAFYRDGLGLPLAFDFKNDKGERTGAYLRCGERTFIEVFRGQPCPPDAKASYKHISIEVENLDALAEHLKARGIAITDKKLGLDHSWQAWITDPDGNRIELHEYTEQSWQVKAME